MAVASLTVNVETDPLDHVHVESPTKNLVTGAVGSVQSTLV